MHSHRKAEFATGSTSGIGLAIVRALAQHGRAVARNGFGGTRQFNKLWCSLREDGGARVCHAGADMHNPAAINAMVEAARRAFGSVDVLIDDAGVKIAARPIGVQSGSGTPSSQSVCWQPFTPFASCRRA